MAAWYVDRHQAGHDRFFKDFAAATALLSTFPLAGRQRDEIRVGLRSSIVHPYLVFYTVDEGARVVIVVRVIHGSRDFGPDDFDVD